MPEREVRPRLAPAGVYPCHPYHHAKNSRAILSYSDYHLQPSPKTDAACYLPAARRDNHTTYAYYRIAQLQHSAVRQDRSVEEVERLEIRWVRDRERVRYFTSNHNHTTTTTTTTTPPPHHHPSPRATHQPPTTPCKCPPSSPSARAASPPARTQPPSSAASGPSRAPVWERKGVKASSLGVWGMGRCSGRGARRMAGIGMEGGEMGGGEMGRRGGGGFGRG